MKDKMTNTSQDITVLIDLTSCSDYITFDVAGESKQVKIVGTHDKPWFCGKDVCEVLEYANTKKALQQHVKNNQKKSIEEFSSDVGLIPFGENNLLNLSYNDGKAVYINESGFFRLIMKSNTRLAEAFQDLVCDYVLPALRRYGLVSVDGIRQQLQDLQIESRDQQQALEEKEHALQVETEKSALFERKALRVAKLMRHTHVKEKKEEWIYVATTEQYSRDRIFKVGSTERLTRRLEGYQTGRPKEDCYYYAWIRQCYASKDLDYHIQRILSDFKYNPTEKGELYVGIKFEDLTAILDVICENYDRSLDYVYGFVKNRLALSQEESSDEPPSAIDLSMVTVHYGQHQQEIALTEETVRQELYQILAALPGIRDTSGLIVCKRKDVIDKMGKVFIGSKKKPIWDVIKKTVGWTTSKSPIENGNETYIIQY